MFVGFETMNVPFSCARFASLFAEFPVGSALGFQHGSPHLHRRSFPVGPGVVGNERQWNCRVFTGAPLPTALPGNAARYACSEGHAPRRNDPYMAFAFVKCNASASRPFIL
jgi:hypothetical protein